MHSFFTKKYRLITGFSILTLALSILVSPVFAAAASLTKNTQTHFDAGSFSQTSYRTVNSLTGVQLDAGGGVDETQYKRPVVIDNTGYASALTNYLVDFTLDTESLIEAGKMQSDCGDIRFRDADDATSITDFEITDCNTANTTIEVKVPSISASSSKTIYLYYGATSTLSSQSSAQSNAVINEDMQTAPSGTLKGSPVATYDATNKYVQLTTNTGGQWGALEYTGNPGADFDATFEFWAGGGSGADATYFYIYSTSTPINESMNTGGYLIYFSEFQSAIRLQYQGGTLASATQASMGDSNWHTARIVKSGLNFKVYYDGVEKINYTDSSRTISGNIIGVGARTGAVNNYHRIRSLSVTGAAPSPEPSVTVDTEAEALYTSGDWTSPSDDDEYKLSDITDWGDGSDDSTAFSATIDNVSDDETIEFQMKTAETADLLDAASFTSLGTASSGDTFSRTKSELADLNIEPEEYVQIKAILSRSNDSSPVLQNFTLSYLNSEQTQLESINNDPPIYQHPSTTETPSCSDAKPSGVPDLFQIDAAGTYMTPYFTTTGKDTTGYTINYGETPAADQHGINFDYTGEDWVLSYTIWYLSPNTTYYVKVRAINGCNAGDWSNTMQVSTKGRLSNITQFYKMFNPMQPTPTPPPAEPQTKVAGIKTENECRYEIKAGDNLWSIAEQKWGNGKQYSQILELNPGLTRTSILFPGQSLILCK